MLGSSEPHSPEHSETSVVVARVPERYMSGEKTLLQTVCCWDLRGRIIENESGEVIQTQCQVVGEVAAGQDLGDRKGLPVWGGGFGLAPSPQM